MPSGQDLRDAQRVYARARRAPAQPVLVQGTHMAEQRQLVAAALDASRRIGGDLGVVLLHPHGEPRLANELADFYAPFATGELQLMPVSDPDACVALLKPRLARDDTVHDLAWGTRLVERVRLNAWLASAMLHAADLERAEQTVRRLTEAVNALRPGACAAVFAKLTFALAELRRHHVRAIQAFALPSGPALERAIAAARARMDGVESPAFADLLRWREAPPVPGGTLSSRAETMLDRLLGTLTRGGSGVVGALQAVVDEGLDGQTALAHPRLGPALRELA